MGNAGGVVGGDEAISALLLCQQSKKILIAIIKVTVLGGNGGKVLQLKWYWMVMNYIDAVEMILCD